MRRYLSWIEGLTTNQDVGGSNPSRRTNTAEGRDSDLTSLISWKNAGAEPASRETNIK